MEALGREYMASADKIKERKQALRAQLCTATKGQKIRICARLRILEAMELETRDIGFQLTHYYDRREGDNQ